jgi:hypothetical protein
MEGCFGIKVVSISRVQDLKIAEKRHDEVGVIIVFPRDFHGRQIFGGPSTEHILPFSKTIQQLPGFNSKQFSVFYSPPDTEYLHGPIDPQLTLEHFVVFGFPIHFFMVPKDAGNCPVFLVERGLPDLFFGIVDFDKLSQYTEYKNITIGDVDKIEGKSRRTGSIFMGTHTTQSKVSIEYDGRTFWVDTGLSYSKIIQYIIKESHIRDDEKVKFCLTADNLVLHDSQYPFAYSMRGLNVKMGRHEQALLARYFKHVLNVLVVNDKRKHENTRILLTDGELTARSIINSIINRSKVQAKGSGVLSETVDGRIERVFGIEETFMWPEISHMNLRVDVISGVVATGANFGTIPNNGLLVQLDVMKVKGKQETVGFVTCEEGKKVSDLYKIAGVSGQGKRVRLIWDGDSRDATDRQGVYQELILCQNLKPSDRPILLVC